VQEGERRQSISEQEKKVLSHIPEEKEEKKKKNHETCRLIVAQTAGNSIPQGNYGV